jgi:transposase InsO family protein
VRSSKYRKGASTAGAVNKILRRFGFKPADEIIQAEARKNDPDKQKKYEEELAQQELEWQRFCRAHPNELWQIDLTTFYIRGQHRVWLIDIIDDHSRFIVGFSLVTEATAAAVMETLRGSFIKHGLPNEILTDQGAQFTAWKGVTQFQKFLNQLGIHHTLARSHHPQTCGKIESFHRSIKRELIDVERFASQEEAAQRIAAYVDHYNYGRPHQGIGGFTPADRYFGIAEEVKRHLQARKALGNDAVAAGKSPAIFLMGKLFGHMVRVQDEAGRLVVHLDGRQVYNADLTPRQVTDATDDSGESDDAA